MLYHIVFNRLKCIYTYTKISYKNGKNWKMVREVSKILIKTHDTCRTLSLQAIKFWTVEMARTTRGKFSSYDSILDYDISIN